MMRALLQLFALQTSVSVVAFARALSSISGAYQLRATVRRPYRRTREGRRGESLTCRNLPRRVPVTRVRHGASARAQLGTLVAGACYFCSSYSHSQPSHPLGLPWWAFRSTRHPHCPPSHDPCACARSCVGSSRAGFCRRAISLSELLQLFALQTRVSVVAFARAPSSSSGAYQLRATVRRSYSRTREGRRGESLTN